MWVSHSLIFYNYFAPISIPLIHMGTPIVRINGAGLVLIVHKSNREHRNQQMCIGIKPPNIWQEIVNVEGEIHHEHGFIHGQNIEEEMGN